MIEKKESYDLEKDLQRLEEIKNILQSGNIKVNDIVPLTEESIDLEKRLTENLNSIKELMKERRKEG